MGLAAALSHFCEEPEKVIAIGVYHRQTTEGRGRGGGVTIGIPTPNLAECHVNSTPPRSCPNVAQSDTDFEVLNTARHTSPKMGAKLDCQSYEGTLGVPQLVEGSPRKALSSPLDQTVLLWELCSLTCYPRRF